MKGWRRHYIYFLEGVNVLKHISFNVFLNYQHNLPNHSPEIE